jgi:hypothetical protein
MNICRKYLVGVGLVLSVFLSSTASPEQEGISATHKSPADVAGALVERNLAAKLPSAKKLTLTVAKTDPVYEFSFGGSSKAILVELPPFAGPSTLSISSRCNCGGPSKSVFVPRVVLLDAQFHETRTLDDEAFAWKVSGSLDANLWFEADQSAERYLLAYTRGDLVGKELGTRTLERFEPIEGPLKSRLNYPVLRAAYGVLQVEMSRGLRK